MNKKETVELLAMLSSLWPMQPIDQAAVCSWQLMLCDYELKEAIHAVKQFVEAKASSFPPNVSELIDIVKSNKTLAVSTLPEPPCEVGNMVRYCVEQERLDANGKRQMVKRFYLRAANS